MTTETKNITFRVTEDQEGCETLSIAAGTAREAAEAYVSDYPKDSKSTEWVHLTVTDPDGDSEGVTVAIHPIEPPCSSDDGHDWKCGPSKSSGGAGVQVVSSCHLCGLDKIDDSNAQCYHTGLQGLDSIKYMTEEDYY